ncbi:hypothetical protein AD998_14605 [bacterium 336/3]|nr:hypothetical protein AD998_14605 [bacterium 336/3]
MEKCKLCKNKDADQTGSHLISHLLLSRVDNVDKKKGRDLELGFAINATETTAYFGRSILTEKLEEVFNIESLDFDNLEKYKSPFIINHIFCSDCENRFSKIESSYSKSVNHNKITTLDISFLFWISIFWRASFKLPLDLMDGHKEFIRILLNKYLPDTQGKYSSAILEDDRLKKVSFKILRSTGFSGVKPTYISCHPQSQNPYILLVDEFLILLSFKDKYNDCKKYKVDFEDNVTNASSNFIFKKIGINEILTEVSEEIFETINMFFLKKLTHKKSKHYKDFFDALEIKLNRRIPTNLRKEILEDMKSKKEGEKDTRQSLNKSTFKILSDKWQIYE